MSALTVRSDAIFIPAQYRQSIAELFSLPDARQQRDLAEKVSLLPRHIHSLASYGLIAASVRSVGR